MSALSIAEAVLATVERPFWDREHTRFALATANEYVLRAPEPLKQAAEALLPAAQAAHDAAIAAHESHGATAADIDAAAQQVLDARAKGDETDA